MKISLNTDGGSRGNPGKSACAFVIKDVKGDVIQQVGFYLGIATNNEAEYTALIKGLQACIDLKATDVTCFLDSELVVKQLNGQYKVKNERIKVLWGKVKDLEKSFVKTSYVHVLREKNAEADKLVNQVLDAEHEHNQT